MQFIYRNIPLDPTTDERLLPSAVAAAIGCPAGELLQLRIVRKALDARKKQQLRMVYSVTFSVQNPVTFWQRYSSDPNLEQSPPVPSFVPILRCSSTNHGPILIVGTGPAGLFCALRLAVYGLTATLVERGRPVEQRKRDVDRFWQGGGFDPESNVQFGEGGAGTFSDGKLTCRLRDPNSRWVLEQLVAAGAPPEILYQAKPHVGTDRLRLVVASIRKQLEGGGFCYRFSTTLTGIIHRSGAVTAALLNNDQEHPCRHLVLATGHSARDTYRMLAAERLKLEPKPFAIGLRVEHPQQLIDQIQYGKNHPPLPPADYSLAWNNRLTGRSCYSFCMCPGGVLVASSSEPGTVVVNGMSNLHRDSGYANSALVVNVRPEDFGGGALGGIRFQRRLEQAAFEAAGRSYHAPAQNLMTFLGRGKGRVRSSYRPAVQEVELDRLLPEYVSSSIREGLLSFEKRMRGFITAEATLTGVESRTSAPVRILRGDDLQSLSLKRLYPCGEGAGYAGGIISAALDGVRVADRIAAELL